MMISLIDMHALARIAASGILNSLVAGIAIAAVARVVVRTGRQSSRTRFVVWFAALIITSIIMLIGSLVFSRTAAPASASGAVILPASFAFYLFIAWIAGATLGLAHVGHGLYRLQRIKATCVPVDREQLDPALRASLDETQSRRRVNLCVSETVRVPAAIGYFRPLVAFPAWALAEIPPQELNAVFLHELAHLRRYDDWTNLAQKLVKAVFFFHPAVWFIESRLTLEREMACDDAVLAANFNPRAYAESLVSLAEKSFLRRGVQLAQAAVSHVKQLKLRLAEILRKDRAADEQGSARIGKPAMVLMSLAAIVAVYGISRAPCLVAFSCDAPQLAAASSASHTVSPVNNFRLQPVNLNFTARSQPANSPMCSSKIRQARLRLLHRAAAKPRVLLAQRAGDMQIVEDSIRPMMMLSNFPIDLNSSPEPVLVVFQGQQFGPNGPVFWRVTILHLTPAQQRAISGGFPKQI
jgi:bla regulator protein blaR1